MPTNTFFHLPEEKQQRLLDAAQIEFSRHSLQEASIANIVKLAGIPRGSFYQYFENKEDLYFYYFATLRKNSERDLEKQIIAENGDLIEAMYVYFSKMIVEVLTGENASFYRNLFVNMDYRASRRVTDNLATGEEEKNRKQHCHKHRGRKGHAAYAEHLYQIIDRSKLTIETPKEFTWFMQTAMHAVFSTIVDGYRQQRENPAYDSTEAVKQLKMKLNWLKNGAYK